MSRADGCETCGLGLGCWLNGLYQELEIKSFLAHALVVVNQRNGDGGNRPRQGLPQKAAELRRG